MSRSRLAAVDDVVEFERPRETDEGVGSPPARTSRMGDRQRGPRGRGKLGDLEIAGGTFVVMVAIAVAGGCGEESERADSPAVERSAPEKAGDASAAPGPESPSLDSAASVLARMNDLRDVVCACKDAACADGAKKSFEELPTAPVRAAPQATREAAGKIIEGFADCYFTFKYGSGARGAP